MTIDEAIKIIRKYECNKEHYDACEMAIKALEQATCEDTVSRQAVAEVLLKYAHSKEGKAFAEFLVSQINALPSVTPQPKVGRWIESKGYDDRDHFYTCSECGRNINLICGATLADYPYCHCGARMKAENE